jgi:type IV secretion system protein VirD4
VWDRNGGVYFGYGADRTEGEPPSSAPLIQYVGDRHLMSIGPIGSGVGPRLLEPNLLGLRDWSVVVVDPDGERAAHCAQRRDPDLQHTIFLNPFGLDGFPSHGFNPVAALDPSAPDFPDDASDLADALIRVDAAAPHRAEAARDLLAALVMASRLTQPNGGSLPQVRQCLASQPDDFRGVVERMLHAAEHQDCPELALKAARFARIDAGNRDLNQALAYAQTQTRWLDSRPIRNDLENPAPIDFAALKDVPTAVFLILPARRLASHATWLRVVIASIVQALMRAAHTAGVPVMLMLDAYPAIARGGFPIIESNMAVLHAHGVKLWTLWQDLAQARTLYGSSFETFLAGCGVLQSFAAQDIVTAEYLSQRSGLTALELEARGRASPSSYQPVPRLLPQDLRNMDEGFSVIFSHKVRNTVRAYMPLPKAPPRRRSLLGRTLSP